MAVRFQAVLTSTIISEWPLRSREAMRAVDQSQIGAGGGDAAVGGGRAWATVWCVIPSSVWRAAAGFGAGLGMSDEWRELQQIPGPGTPYVLSLSVLSIVFASLTLGLVYPWGERVPAQVPVVGGRRYPTWLAGGLAAAGVAPLVVTGLGGRTRNRR